MSTPVQSHPVSVPDPLERPTLTVTETSEIMGLSLGSTYAGVRSGQIPSVRVGSRYLVPTAALRRLLQLEDDDPAA